MAFPSSPFNLDMIEFRLPPFFYYENVCRSRSHSFHDNPYDPIHYYTEISLFVSYADPRFLSIFNTEMEEKMVRAETFWRVAWPVFSGILHRSKLS